MCVAKLSPSGEPQCCPQRPGGVTALGRGFNLPGLRAALLPLLRHTGHYSISGAEARRLLARLGFNPAGQVVRALGASEQGPALKEVAGLLLHTSQMSSPPPPPARVFSGTILHDFLFVTCFLQQCWHPLHPFLYHPLPNPDSVTSVASKLL